MEPFPMDLIVTDPPYAMADLPLWNSLGRLAAKALRPGGYMAALSGLQFLPEVLAALGEGTGLKYFWTICLHFRGPNGRRHGLGIVTAWRPIVVFYKPPFSLPQRQVMDHYVTTLPIEKAHVWEQRPEAFSPIIENFSQPGDLVLDPFGGSGAVMVAARSLGRHGLGVDNDPAAIALMQKRLAI